MIQVPKNFEKYMMQEYDEFKQAYEKAKSTLIDKEGNPTPHYQAYLKYEEEWKNKRKAHGAAYENALTNPLKLHMWAVEGKQYIDDINSAMDQWITLGYKVEIENAIKILATRNNDPDVIAMMQQAQNRQK
jgi:hypothetical protein